jgi:hypothetical protein
MSEPTNRNDSWDGVERRCGGSKPSRIGIILERELFRPKATPELPQRPPPPAPAADEGAGEG